MLSPASASLMQSVAEPMYVTSLEELAWAAILTAVTMALHGVGMVATLRIVSDLKHAVARWRSFAVDLGAIIVASWLILLVHLVEVLVWAAFFLWKGELPNASTAYYFALLEYTTLGSDIDLPLRWRLLKGGVAIAGLLAFAWSTGVLLLLARDLQDDQLTKHEQRRQKRGARRAETPADGPTRGA